MTRSDISITHWDPSCWGSVPQVMRSPRTERLNLAGSFTVLQEGQRLRGEDLVPYTRVLRDESAKTLARLRAHVLNHNLALELHDLGHRRFRTEVVANPHRMRNLLIRSSNAQVAKGGEHKPTLVFSPGYAPTLVDRSVWSFPSTPPPKDYFEFVDLTNPPRRIPTHLNGKRIVNPFASNAAMRTFARWATAEAETPEQKVKLLFEAILARLNISYNHDMYDPYQTAIQVFNGTNPSRNGKPRRLADCVEICFLFVSLLQTIGIKSYLVFREDRGAVNHVLAAVLLNGGIHYYNVIHGLPTRKRPHRTTILTHPISAAYFHYWRAVGLKNQEAQDSTVLEAFETVHAISPTDKIKVKIKELERKAA